MIEFQNLCPDLKHILKNNTHPWSSRPNVGELTISLCGGGGYESKGSLPLSNIRFQYSVFFLYVSLE